MTKEQALAAIKAAGWSAAAGIGWREAVEMLQDVASEIKAAQWKK